MLLHEYSQEKIDSAIASAVSYFNNIEAIDSQRMQRQIEIAKDIIKTYQSGTRNVIMEAPTGFGKSILGFFLTKFFEHLETKDVNAYMLTSNKFLQDQYSRDVNNFDMKGRYAVLKGQANYICNDNKKQFPERTCSDVSVGKLLNDKDWGVCAKTCPYVQARIAAQCASTTIFNYSYWLTSMNLVYAKLVDHAPFKPRPLTIFDEAHLLGDIVQNMFSTETNIDYTLKMAQSYYMMQSRIYHDLPQNVDTETANIYKIVKTLDDHQNSLAYETQYKLIIEYAKSIGMLADAFAVITRRLTKTVSKDQKPNLTEDQKRFVTFNESLHSLFTSISVLSSIYKEFGFDSIVLTVEQKTNQRTRQYNTFVKLQCTDESAMVTNHVLKYSMYGLFMSATIGDIDKFASQNGITDYHKMYVDSDFEFDKSPIYKITPSLSMTYKHKHENLPKLLKYVEQILAHHPDERGVIHTGNYEFMNALKQLQNPRMLFYENAGQKPEMMRKLQLSKNAVICGPSLLEGVDLKDDLSRFMIFMKVPYKAIGDKLTKRKMEKYKNWYGWITSVHVQQGMGRPIRHAKDWAVTYLLDGAFNWFFTQNQPAAYINKRIKVTNINSIGSSLDDNFDESLAGLFN